MASPGIRPAAVRPEFFAGLDLGQGTVSAATRSDRSALAVLQLYWPARPRLPAQQWGKPKPAPAVLPELHLRHLARFKVGTPYPVQVREVSKVLLGPELRGKSQLVVDGTGVGRAVVDLFREAGGVPLTAVTITSGMNPSFVDGYWRIPKRDLIQAVQVLFQQGRLKFAKDLPLREHFEREMLAFKVEIDKVTAHDTYEGRKGMHDDIVLAVAIAVWRAMRLSGGSQATAPRARKARRFGSVQQRSNATQSEWWENEERV